MSAFAAFFNEERGDGIICKIEMNLNMLSSFFVAGNSLLFIRTLNFLITSFEIDGHNSRKPASLAFS